MLHIQDEYIRNNLLKGAFGLEKENLRVMSDGFLSHTPNPVTDDEHIVRDFSEGQMEINTYPYPSAEEAVEALVRHEKDLVSVLSGLPEREYLWPFSNPPYIKGEDDIPIAEFEGEDAWKTEYRKHLSCVYGRYKMTFSGIHVNYSLDEELLRHEAELRGIDISDEKAFREFKDSFYISLTEKRSSLRCSERGYWNFFDPVFDYSSLDAYTDSIEQYVTNGDLMASSELYYPVRLKPNSACSIERLREDGAGHIELRMFDLNPLCDEGVDIRDIRFAGYLVSYLAMGGSMGLSPEDQVNIVSNFKYSARLDLDGVYIIGKGGFREDIREAALGILETMKEFYKSMLPQNILVQDDISFQISKLTDEKNRYAYRVLQEYGTDYVKKGMELAKVRQG